MPTYDYLCPNGHRFEVIHSVTADGPSSCPICGAAPVRKAFTAPTIHFKGSGWAKKDRSTTARSSTPAASADGSAGSGSGSGSGSSDGAETGSRSGSDKGDGEKSGASTSSEPTKASDKGSPSSTTKSKDSAASSGPAAGD